MVGVAGAEEAVVVDPGTEAEAEAGKSWVEWTTYVGRSAKAVDDEL